MTVQKSALVFGATGLIGGHLLRELLDSATYGKVTAVVRRDVGVRHPKFTQLSSDLQSINKIKEHLIATDVFCCLGTTRKKTPDLQDYYRIDHDYPVIAATLAKENHAQAFLLVSAVGANAESSNFYLRMKGETERDISAVGFGKLHIFRPSLLLVNGRRRGGWKRYRSIPATTVAQAMYQAAQKETKGTHIYYGNEMRNLT